MLSNICTDIETLSTKSNAIIVSISAIKFSLTTDDTQEFTININPRSSKVLGLHIEQETLDWWKTKPEAAKAWMTSQVDIATALTSYYDFCGDDKSTLHFCNGENFDFPILASSFDAVGSKPPWRYYNLRDMRTIFWLGGIDTFKEPRVGTYHNGLDDCRTQIAWLKKVLRS